MALGWTMFTALVYFCIIPMGGFIIMLLLSPIDPLSYDFLFDVTHSSLTEFNFTATTNIDGTRYFHYKYNLGLNITVRKPDKNYDFVHYVLAFYKNKRFAMVDLNSFYGGKELTNTTELLSLAHSLKGQYDVLVIDHPAPVDGLDPSKVVVSGGAAPVDVLLIDHPVPVECLDLSKVDCGGDAAITDDDNSNMVARLYYSVSPPWNTTWPYKTIYSKEELEFKCELELKFPLINGQSAQLSNTSSLKTIECEPYVLTFSCKYYLFLVPIVFVVVFIVLLLAFILHCVDHYHDQPFDDPSIHDSIPLKQPLLQG